jgi:hypothetical protein
LTEIAKYLIPALGPGFGSPGAVKPCLKCAIFAREMRGFSRKSNVGSFMVDLDDDLSLSYGTLAVVLYHESIIGRYVESWLEILRELMEPGWFRVVVPRGKRHRRAIAKAFNERPHIAPAPQQNTDPSQSGGKAHRPAARVDPDGFPNLVIACERSGETGSIVQIKTSRVRARGDEKRKQKSKQYRSEFQISFLP